MTSESYQCPASVLPFEYSGWDEKWYSPVCRGWFKDSLSAGNRGIISDPYMMAGFNNTIGITPCMPLLDGTGKEPIFKGALCQDILLTDQTKFFNQDVETKRFIFK